MPPTLAHVAALPVSDRLPSALAAERSDARAVVPAPHEHLLRPVVGIPFMRALRAAPRR